MDIRSIIDSDSAPAKPASRQRSDAKLAYPQTQPVLHSQYEVQPSAYKGPREKRPPQPPPLQPPVHNDGRAPGALSHNPAQSPYQQSPSTARGGGQYLYSQHPIQSPVLGLQSSPYAQRESHLISTGNNYQAQSQPTSISPTSNATTPVALHAYPHQNRQSSSHSIPTPTSTQSQLPNMFSESPQASHPQIQTSSQSNSSQQYLSQPGTPLGPPSVFGRPPLLHRGSSGSYEHQRNHSGGSYGHQQAMASSPRKDALGSSGVSPLSGPRQFVSHSQSYQTKNEREQSLSVSPKTKLPGELHLHQLHDEIAAKFKNHSSLTSAPPKEDKSELYSPQGQSAIQSSNRSHSLGMKGILNMPKVNERTSNSGKSNSLTRSSLSEISNQDLKTPTRSESLLLPTLGISSTPHASQEPTPQPQQFSPHQQSSQIHAVPNWQSQAIPKSLTKLQTPSIAQTPTISYPATPVQKNPLPIPPTAAQTPQVSLSPASVQTSPASLPPPPPPPLPAAAASSLQTPSLSVPISSAVVQTPPVSIASAYIQTAMHSSMPADTTVHQTAIKQQGTAAVNLVGSPSPLVRRRRRHDEPPIWARSARQFMRVATGYSNASNKRHLANKSTMQATQDAGISRAISAEPPLLAANPTVAKQVKLEANGYALQTTENPISRIHSAIADPGLLGPWETNILNTIPSEETIRAISDFLYTEVVGRPDVGSGPAGGGSSKGAILEIEAKIGQLIDKNTNNRLRLPIVTECVLDKQDPNLRVAFKSSMTEAQHRSLNGFLNKALVSSQAPKGPPIPPSSMSRIPMSYIHTYESDTFYELSQSGTLSLPASIRSLLNPRNNKAKVRVTTDQKTGKEIAKIVKVRIADLDIYSPKTAFDWRISVNLEMSLYGDMKDLVEPLGRNARRADRNKDRMSYKHLAYQIDLTQVTTADATSKTDKEHELEIEISTDELRKHGILLRDRYPNEFEKLVEGFVSNVRILARHCQ